MELTVANLFTTQSSSLELNWKLGHADTQFNSRTIPKLLPTSNIANNLNLVRPHPIQIIGKTETDYFISLGKNSHADALQRLFLFKPTLIIFTDSTQASDTLLKIAEETQTNVFTTPVQTSKVIEHLQFYFSQAYAQNTTIHGVFLEVFGVGTLLTGKSSIGKSELALELLTRGHKLIADDAIEFYLPNPATVTGKCPELLKDFLEVRGLGILNIRAMFGDNAITNDAKLRLIIDLQNLSDSGNKFEYRLDEAQRSRKILDKEFPEVSLPVAVGRSLAVIVEAAVRNHVLKSRGYDAMQDFIKKQQKTIKNKL